MRVCVTMNSYRPKFAWIPTRMTGGGWVWFQTYQSINGGKHKRRYDTKA